MLLTLTLTNWLILFLVVSYLTTALVDSTGPLWIFATLREWLEDAHLALQARGRDRLSQLPLSLKHLTECYICASIWVSLVVVWLIVGQLLVVHSLAIAGAYVIYRQSLDAFSKES